MGMWRSLHPFHTTSSPSRRSAVGRRRISRAQRQRHARRVRSLERFEERFMLNGGPELISILANSGDVVYAPYIAGQTTSLHTAPRELDLLFNQGATIDPTTLGGVQVVSAGADGRLNTADDVPIEPGFVGLGNMPNEVVLRFAQSLPDDLYQVTLVGKGPQALTDTNSPPDLFNSGNLAQPNLQVAFKVDAGPNVLSVVPEPVRFNPSTGLLQQANNEIDVYFDKAIQSLPQQFGQLDPQLFQLIYTANTATTADDIAFNPSSVSFDSATNKATLIFSTPLEAIGSGAFRLRIGDNQNVSGDRGVMTPTVVSVPEPATGTFATAATVPYNNGKLDQNTLQDNQVIVSSQLGADAIDPGLGFPGGNSGPGVRNVPTQQHINLGTAALPPPIPGVVPTITYNFPDVYGSTQGTGPLHNVITAAEESLTREIFQLYSYYLGVQFREVSSTELGAANLGIVTGVTQAVSPNAPSSLPAATGQSTYGNQQGYLAVMNASTFNNQATPYGGAWFQSAMQQIGRLLGLGDDAEGPPGTIMGLGLNDPATGQPAEPVFPGNADILHGQYLYRPLSDNVDLYSFTVSTPGQFSAETIAQRLVSSVINLPQTGSAPVGSAVVDGSTFTVNDGVHPPVTFEFAADGRTVTDGNVAIAYHSSDTAPQVAADVAAAINGATTSGNLSTQATVNVNQVVLSGLPKITANGNQGQVTYGQQPSQLNSVITLYNQTNVIQVTDTGVNTSGQPNGIGPGLYGSTFTLSDGVHPAVTFQYAKPWEVDIAGGLTGGNVVGATISVTQGSTTKTFEFTTGTLPNGDSNVPIVVAATDGPAALAAKAAQAINGGNGFSSPGLANPSGGAVLIALASTGQLVQVSGPGLSVQSPGNAPGNVPVEFAATATAHDVAVAIANAVNSNTTTSGLNASANVQFEQVVLGGPLTVTSSGGAAKVSYSLQHQIISRNDDYFGNDSFVRMNLTPGVYFVAVTSTGNTQFDPNVAGSGFGGTTQGPYDLKLDFTPASQALKTLTDTDGNRLHGNSNGTTGGAYDFWFNVGSTIFVDKTPPANSAASGQPLGSVSNPYTNLGQALKVAANRIVAPAGTATLAGQTFVINDGVNTPVTFEFVQNGQSLPAGDFNVPVKYNVGDSAAAVAEAIVAAINSSPKPLFVTPTYYDSDSEFEPAGNETPTNDTDQDENVIDLQVPNQGTAFVDVKGSPALLAGARIVRVLGTAGADHSIGVPLGATMALGGPANASAQITPTSTSRGSDTFQVTAGSFSETFEFTTSSAGIQNGLLADGNLAVLVAPGASAHAIALAMAQAINSSPLSLVTGGTVSASVSSSASAGPNGEAWWITLAGVGTLTINTQNAPALLSVSDATPYEIGTSQFGGALADGGDLTVPQGVTMMIDAGAVFKLESANVTVGENAPGVDYSESALQVLGTPTSSVYFTSFHDNSVGSLTDTVTAPTSGDWGGIVFGPNADLENQGVFLDTVSNARLTYGGGAVSVNGVLTPFTPIYLDGSRPAITHDTILQSHNSAISADPNSFGETIFGGPAYDPSTGASLPVAQAYVSDYERAGPDIQGNTLSMVQSGPQTINAAPGNQIVQGETFVVFNPSNPTAAPATFEFINSEALLPGSTVAAGALLPDGNYAVLFSPGEPANGSIPAVPPDTAAQVAAEIAAAINATKLGVTATVPAAPANSGQVVISGDSQVVPSSPTSFNAPDSSLIVDGETFVVRNLSTGATATFEFNSTAAVAAGHVRVAYTVGDSPTTVAGEMAAAINGVTNLGVLAVLNGSQVVLSGAVDFQFGGSTGLTANPRVLTTSAGSALTDGSTFQITNNQTGATTTFQYQLDTDTPPATPSSNIIIQYSLSDQDTDVANETAAAINAANLGVSAGVSGNQVSLIETPSGQFVSPLSMQSMVVTNTLNGLFIRTQNATTQLPESLSVSARWTATDIPYVLSDNLLIQGNPGGPLDSTPRLAGRLDIDPGVTIKLGGSHIETQFGGNLLAEGTASNPIVFTSLHDDSYGGGGTFDTDGDNSNTASAPALPQAGDWSGLYFAPTSHGSLDHTLIAYGGGGSTVQGNSDNFNAVEIHQAAVRIANSTLENNAAGLASDTRAGLQANDSATIFVLGAQPAIVNNVFENNRGATISINADAMTSSILPDPGRSTGAIDRFTQFDSNRGPLVRLNQIGNALATPGVINGMLVRGGTLDTSSVWDDTDIVHVVKQQIQVPNVDSRGGLMLQSSASASLVVKFGASSAGLTATGTPLDISDRIGGSVQIIGTPSHPVVLTALGDETVGAGLTPQGQPQKLTDNGLGLVQTGQALLPTVPEVNRGTTIDNDVATNVVGHFEAKIGPGGDMGTDTTGTGSPFLTGITAQGRTQLLLNQNFVFDFANYVDVGSTGAATRLSATTIDQAPTRVAPDVVVSKGHFTGKNGTINWTVTSSFKPGTTQLVNQVGFDSSSALGDLRFINYLDEDVPPIPDDDLLYTQGTPGQPGFQVFTIDGPERVGVSQGGVYQPGPQLVNATYDGWAADSFDNLQQTIATNGGTFTVAGNINTTNLPPGTDPQLGQIYGPADQTTAFAWNVDPNALNSLITTFLSEVSGPAAPPGGQWKGVTLDQYSNDRNVAVVNETESANTGGAGTNDTPATAQSLGQLAPNQKSGDDTQRLGFVVNGSISTPSDADVYTFKAQPGTQVWMSLGNTSPALDSVLEVVDANGTVLARSDNALAESENPALLGSSASGSAGFAGNLAMPLNSGTLLLGNYDPSNPSLNNTVYDPASQNNPGLRNLSSTNPFDAGFRLVLPGNPNSPTPQDYYVRVRSRGPDLTNIHGGQSSGAYQLQVRLQEQEEFPGSTVQYADIRFAKNGVDVVGLPAHSPLLGETAQAGSAQNTDASTPPANQPDPRPIAQDLGDPLASDRAAVSVAGNLATPTTVTWYKFELNYDFLNAIQSLNAGQKTWSTIFDVDYADGLARPNTNISVFDSSGKLIYLGRDSNVADDQPTPNSANGLTDLTHGSAGQLDPYIGSVQLPAGAFSFTDISPAATDTTIPGNLISVTFNGVTKVFQFTAGALPQGSTNIPIMVAAGDTAPVLASKAAQAIDTAFNNPNFVTLNGLRLTFPNGSVADTSGALVTTSNTYYVAISSDAALPQAVDASFNGGSANTLVRLEPIDSVNRVVEDHIGSQGGETAQPPGTLTPMFTGTVDTTNFNPAQPTSAQFAQVQSLNASAVPFTLGNVVLFVDQNGVGGVQGKGDLETVNPFTGGRVTDIGNTRGTGLGFNDIAMRNDGQLFGLALGPGASQYDLIDTGTAASTNSGNTNIQVAQNAGVQFNALAFVENGLNRQLFAVGSFSGAGGAPPFRNGFYQLDPNSGNSLNNPQSTPVLLSPSGVAANETITGMATIGGTLYAVTDAGGLYIISNPGGQASLVFVGAVKDANGNPISFTGLTAGPPDVSGGAYADDLFAADAQGKLYAVSTSGTLLPVFSGGATSVSLGVTNVVGLAFSTLDYNLWHVTDQRGGDAGHGFSAAPDNSRNTGSANQPQAGNLSFYFGLESPDQTKSPGAIDNPADPTQTLQPGAANYATNLDANNVNRVYNTYNLPGGALGTLQTNSFSLANYTYGDKPTLYFNYFLATQNASSSTQNPGTMLDSARVFISADNGKTWQMLATNDSSRQQANVAQPDGELPSFASASSSAYPNGVVPQRIQQLYDTAGGTWRQARIDLGDFAGQANLKLRFDFSSAGSMNQGLPGDSFGNFNSPARGQNNRNEGFYVDDITVGFAERGEMVTGDQANMTFVPTPQNPNSNAPTQILTGPYQLDIRRGTEYGVNVSPNLPDITLIHSFDTNDRLVDGFSILAPAGSALTDGQSFQISDGTHVVSFEFDQGDTLTVAGNIVNNDSFTINDGTNSKQFVFIVNGNPLNPPPKQPNQVQVFVKSTDSPAVVASDIATAVNGSGLAVRAVTNVDPAYTGALAPGQVRLLATGSAVPQINISGARELLASVALHGGTPVAYAPGFTAAQVADAITNAINANTTLVGVRAGAVRNVMNGALKTTGNRVDLFGAASVTAMNSVAGQLTVSATAHSVTETGATATTQVTVSRNNAASLASPVSVQIQALDLIRYDQNATTGAFSLGTGEPSTNVQLINPATNQPLQPGSPLTVLIPAGQTSVTFGVRAVEQTGTGGAELADGPLKVQLVATALNYTSGAETLDVTDDIQVTPTLTLNLTDPANGAILENAGPGAAHATLTRNTPDNVPLTVTLTSLDPSSARVPATVTIPAGSFSVTFPIDAVDDNILRSQAVNVTIVASAVNFVSGTTSVAVLDDGDQNQIPQNVTAWQSQGPSPIQFGQDANVTGSGGAFNPVAGAIETVLSNPTNPNILYVGTVNGGVWETTNATSPNGPNWTPLTDNMPSLSIGALQFDATDATYQHLIAGIGRFSSFANAGGQLSGLIVSSDGGRTWTPVTPSASSPATPVGQNISGVAQRGNIILAAGNYFFNNAGGLYRSTDNGATFNLVSGQVGSGLPAGPISDLVGDPLDTKRFYAAVLTKGIFTSDDNGATWVDVTPSGLKSILNTQAQGDNIRIANSGASVYFGYEKFDPLIGGSQLAAIYYSPATNLSSTTWTAMDLPTTNENGTIVGLNPDIGGVDVPGAQGEIHFSIVADPNNPNLVYVGGDRQPDPFPNSIGATNFTGRLFRGDSSKPLGSQWTPITDNFTANQSAPHADSRHMTFDSTGRLIESDDGGVFTLSNPETSQGIWTSLNGNLAITEIHSIAYDTNTNTLIAGDQDTGTPEQPTNGSASWSEFTQGDGGDVAVDDSNPNQSIRYTSFPSLGLLYASTYDNKNNLININFPTLTVTNAGNASIQAVDIGLPFVTTLKLNSLPGFANHLVIGGGSAVYESFDGGQTLTELMRAGNPVGGVGAFQLFGAAMAYGGTSGGIADPSVLWFGANAQVFLRFGGFNSPIGKTNYSGGNVRSLVINPNNWRNAIVVDSSNHVWLTADGGASFTDISGNLTNSVGGAAPLTSDLFSVAFVPGSSTNLIYVGSRDGVYMMKTAQQGVWSRYGSFLPDVPVYSLQYVPSQQLLVAGTMGRGAFTASAIGAAGDITATVNTQNVSDDGGVITGTVTRSGTFGALAVTLASSDPALVPPTTVTIPDGQSTQTFSINLNDLLDANGNEVAIPRETVVLTPFAGGLNPIATYVNVTEDNPTGLTTSDDLPALSVTLSAKEMNPNFGVNSLTGTVSRNTPTDQPLTVTLAVSDPTRASAIQNGNATVVIPAGSQSVNFTLNYVDQFANDGQPHWITVAAAGITYQGLGITSDNGDGNDNEDPELADPTGASLDGDESFTVKVDAAQHILSYDRRGDANINRDQGQVIVSSSRISNSLDYGIVVEPGPRDVFGNLPHPGAPLNLSTINSDRVAPGATIENNLLVANGAGGIQFLGDPNAGAGPLAAVPFGRIVNNTIYGGTQQTGVGVQVAQNASPTILNNIFANLATGVSVDNTSSSTHLEASVYQNDGTTLSGNVFNGADLFGVTLSPTDPLFANAANGDFYLAPGSKAIDSAITSLSDRPDMISAKSLTGIPASFLYAPSRDLYGQLRVADPETNPSGVGATLFQDRGAIERVDFTGPTAALANPIDNSSLDQDPTTNVVHEVGASLNNFAIQLNDGSGVGIDDSTVNGSKFSVYRDGVRLTSGIDYFFSYDTNTKTAYFTPATGTWANGHQYTIYVNNGSHFDPSNAAAATPQNAIKDLAANPLQPNRGTGSPTAGFTQFDVLLQNTGGDAPSIGVPGIQTTPENTPLAFGTANPITIFNIDAPGDTLTVTLSSGQGTLSLDKNVANVTINGNGTSNVVITGTAAAINAALSGTAAPGQPPLAPLTFTPTQYFFGTATIQIAATDPATGLTGHGVATIGVIETNQAPVITVPPTQLVNENPATALIFSTATGNPITITDPNGGNGPDQVTITVPNGVVTLSGTTGLTFTQGGRVGSSMTFTGLLTDVNAALNGMTYRPAKNFTGATSIAFTAVGQASGTNPQGTGKALINVVPVNQPPAAIQNLPDITTNEVAQTTVLQVIDLNQYIVDPDVNNTPPEAPPTFLVTGNNNPSLVSATINGHLLTLTLNAYQYGTANIGIEAIDSNPTGVRPFTTSFNVNVQPVNYPAVTTPSEFVYAPGQPLVITAPGVLANDFDHNGHSLTAVLSQVPAHGKLVLNGDGSFTYVPDVGFNGRDSFVYKADYTATLSDGSTQDIRTPATVYLDSPTSLWVARMYSEVLGRTTQPADAEINYWVSQLNAGMSRTQIANFFVTSPERRSHVIADLYQTYLGRAVDPAGLNYWLNVWNASRGPEQVQAGIIGSQEFFNTAGGTPQAWVTALYQNLFERNPGPSEVAYWVGVIQSQSRASVVLGFVTSDEYRLNLLRGIPNDPDDPDGPSDPNEPNDSGWYMQYLHRPIDQAGALYWLNQMKAGYPQEAILEGILGSAEYFNRA